MFKKWKKEKKIDKQNLKENNLLSKLLLDLLNSRFKNNA